MNYKNGRYAVKEKIKDDISTSSFNNPPTQTVKKEWIFTLIHELYWMGIKMIIRMLIDVFVFFILLHLMNKLGILKIFTDTFNIIKDTARYIQDNIKEVKDEIKNGAFANKFVD